MCRTKENHATAGRCKDMSFSNANEDTVVIVGGGPAGAATAIELRRRGVPCTVINATAGVPYKPGESLPPNARGVMQELGVLNLLQDEAHLCYTGNVTAWGTDELLSRYFFAEPFGNGWHLDRLLFEAQLKHVAVTLGARWLDNTRFVSLTGAEGSRLVHARDEHGGNLEIPSAFVIDCSGRASVVGRSGDGRRHVLDHLAAYCFVLDMKAGDLNGVTFIETVKDGWWYAAPLPQDRVVVNFMSDSDLHKVAGADLAGWLMSKLSETTHLKQRLQASVDTVRFPLIKTATTSVLLAPAGDGWLAAGDALCTYDPLTSFGITIAMAGGRQAAEAVCQLMEGDVQAVGRYLAMQQDTFNNSLAMLQTQYSLEKRWATEPFWQRRQ